MKLVLAYFNNSHQDVYIETLDTDYDDKELYEKSDRKITDEYSLKLIILQNYFTGEYKNDIVDNQEQYENDFDEFFTYNFYVI